MSGRPCGVRAARIYDLPDEDDGVRVLVDRVWPRGVSKQRAHADEWLKAVAPSTALRKWYGHDPRRFDEFAQRYRDELREPEAAAALAHLRELARERSVTMLTATKDVQISQASVLVELLRGRA